MMRKILLAAALLALVALYACGSVPAPTPEPTEGFIIAFDYEKQSGSASNQYAVWIEDADGTLVKTLYATGYTAKGGYKNRPDSIPLWVAKSGLASMKKSEADAVAGATPKSGPVAYHWDLTDSDGNAVVPGEYFFFIEGTLRWKNRVLYSGNVDGILSHEMQFIFEGNDRQPALAEDAPETRMITNVTVRVAE